MSAPILATKLFVPPPRPDRVPRPQLIERLDLGLRFGRKLTLVSAPAGFGKTTLIAEWAASLLRMRPAGSNPKSTIGNLQLSWFSLDEEDNNLARFLAYLIAAFNQTNEEETAVGKVALEMLQSPQTPPASAVLTIFINDIAKLPGKIVLIIDDFHVIESAAVEESLTYLLEHQPPNLHLVIATRIDPQIPFARLRVRGQLTEIRAADLRFSSAEAAEFLNGVMGLDLSAEDITALERRTEGWIAGLQLAAITMRGQKDTSGLIKSFTGSHRYVLDYLIEEVLEQQPAEIQDFLLQTAVLDRLTGSLCAFLTGQKDGQETLEMLDRANLFIVPLDEERRWYRYHHLFGELLRRRLRQTRPEQIPTLHRRAGRWYEQKGFNDAAIDQALLGEDYQHAARLIQNIAADYWKRGEDSKLRRWLERLPPNLIAGNCLFCIYLTWCLLADGEVNEAQKALLAAEQALESMVQEESLPPDLSLEVLQGRIAAAHAFSAFYRGEFADLFHYAGQALELLPPEDLAWRSVATHFLGDAYDFQGDMVQAYPSRLQAVEASKATGNSYVSLISHLKLAIIMRRMGMLREVDALCRRQLQRAAEIGMAQTVLGGWLLAIWGETLVELNDLESAQAKAELSAERLEGDGDLAMIGSSYLGLIRIMFSCGRLAVAERYIHMIEALAQKSAIPPWITGLADAWQARIWLAQSNFAALSSWVVEQEKNLEQNISYVHETVLVETARFYIAQRRLEEAHAILDMLSGQAQQYGRIWRVIEIAILQALAYQAGGKGASALAALEQALIAAEPGGFTRIFLDEGPPLAALLHEANTRGILPAYTNHLLAAFALPNSESPIPNSELRTPHSPTSAIRNPKSEILEPLSDRELEVLRLIAGGLTNSQIAARLYLTLNTVKAHTRNIYGKLDVHTRTQAVARARDLGLIG